MRRPAQAPTERPGYHVGDMVREHPAFGCVVVTRPAGAKRDAEMFGSRVPVNSYIAFTLHEAYEDRRSQSSSHQPGRIVARFNMTEAQFAAMVGSVGNGSGTPCTLTYRQTGEMVEVPSIKDFSLREDRARHIRDMTAQRIAELKAATAKLDALLAGSGPISKSALREVRQSLIQAVDNAPANYQFAADQVSEHLADTLSEIKMELHAYALATGAVERVTHRPRGGEDDAE